MIFSVVPPTLITVLWPQFVQYLAPVADVSSGELTLETIKDAMVKGKNIVIVVIDDDKIIGVNTVEVFTYDTGLKCLYVPIIGGERIDEWGEEFFCMCKEFALQNGCTEIRGYAARGGWIRKLASHNLDWHKCYEVISYSLEEK